MGTYYKFKATRSKQVPYSFQCEHCMKDSGLLSAEIIGAAEENSLHKTLNAAQQEKLDKAAFKNLGDEARKVYKNATEKQSFDLAFKDECPHCKKSQSWSIAGVKGDAISTLITILVVGAVVCTGVYFTQEQNLLLTLAFVGVFAVIAVGYSIMKAIIIMTKKRKTNSVMQKNVPIINWAPIQEFLELTDI